MLLGQHAAVGRREVALVVGALGRRVGVEALFGLLQVVETGVQGRQARVGRPRGVRDSELAAHAEILHHEPLDDEVVRKPELVALVIVVQVGVPQGIADSLGFERFGILVIIEVAVDLPLVVVLLKIGIGLRILREGNRGIVGFLVVEREFVAELEFPGPVDQVDVAADGLTVGTLHHALHLTVAQTDAVADLLLAALGVDIVLVGESRAQRLVQPVGVDTPGDAFQPLVAQVVQPQLVGHAVSGVLIHPGKGLELEFLTGIHQIIVRQIGHRDAEIALVGELQTPPLGRLGLDHDHAVRGLRTVDGRRSGVLEQRHRRHAVHIQVHHRLQRRFESVEDEQRLVGVRAVLLLQADHAALAADFEIGHAVGVGTELDALGDLERGVQRAEALQDALRTHGLEFLGFERGRRTRETLLLALVDARHHHVGHLHGGRRQRNLLKFREVPPVVVLHMDFITDEREHDVVNADGNFQHVTSVGIRGGSDGRSLDDDRHARHRAPVRPVGDPTCDLHELRLLGNGLRGARQDHDRAVLDPVGKLRSRKDVVQHGFQLRAVERGGDPLVAFQHHVGVIEEFVPGGRAHLFQRLGQRHVFQHDRHPLGRRSLRQRDAQQQRQQHQGPPPPPVPRN